MSRVALLLVLPVFLACSKKEEPAADTSAAAVAPAAAAPAPVNYAGKWKVDVMPEANDSVLLSYTIEATNDKTGWKIMLPGRDPMDVRVLSMDNDSAVLENGPYESVLRKKVQVSTHSTMHVEGDKSTGRTIAHYSSKGPDSVRVLRTSGSRM